MSQLQSDINQINFAIGDVVYVGTDTQRIGKIEFIGETQFAAGEWIGVSLFSPLGKNDGSVDGVVYFKCEPSHGIFSKRGNIRHASNTDVLEPAKMETTTNNDDRLSIGLSKQDSIADAGSVCSSRHSAVNSHIIPPGQCGLQIGDLVQVSGGRVGILRYLGPTEFAVGEWAGVELDEPTGKNDGSVAGVRYFTCKPNYGLFAAANRVVRAGTSKDESRTSGFNVSKNGQTRQSQESLLSYSSNLSSVSRSYRTQPGNNGLQGRNSLSGNRKPVTPMNGANRRENASNLLTLQRLIKEKEAHIEQLLQEREIERSDLAKVTLEKEMAQAETVNQRAVIQQLNQQLENMEAVLQHLRDEHEQTTIKLHEERKNLEDLQFRMEEENIDKTTLESQNADDESKIFELEEALMSAREANERMETELNKVRAELNNLLQKQSPETLALLNESISQKQDQSLQRTEVVSEVSIPPNEKDEQTLKEECERLRVLLAERQTEAEDLLKRQSETIQSLTTDFNEQIKKLNSELEHSSIEMQAFKDENNALKLQNNELVVKLKNEIEQLNKQLTEQEKSANEKLLAFEKRITELNNILEAEKLKSASSPAGHHQQARSEELNNLKQQQKAVLDDLTEYHNNVLSNAELCHSAQVDEINSLQADNSDNNSSNNENANNLLLEKIKAQEQLLNEQKEQLAHFQLQYKTSIQDKENSESRLGELEVKQDELLMELNGARSKRDQLVEEICTMLGDLSVAEKSDNLSAVLHQRINDLKEQISYHEKNRQDLQKYCQTLENERNELESELTRVNVTLKNASEVQSDSALLKEELDTVRQKMLSLEKSASNAFDQLEVKSNELQAIQNQLDKVLAEQMEHEKVHNHTISVLETEKQVLLERIQEAENRLAQQQQQSKLPVVNMNQASQESEKVDVNRLLEEKASSEAQINFLNSIIVDLHAKNAELESRVRAMLVGADEHLDSHSNKRTKPPPRLWCDNCLVFDSHDTKDCPQTTTTTVNNKNYNNGTHINNGVINNNTNNNPPSSIDDTPHRRPSKTYHKHRISSTTHRIYCDNCGVFDDHITENCTDAQTF
ncbi:unnamed protein product [Trichobilharzia szidati]|nr:unnamed protein product [Trichobilharzia szidati]